jgi:hypothetical protein
MQMKNRNRSESMSSMTMPFIARTGSRQAVANMDHAATANVIWVSQKLQCRSRSGRKASPTRLTHTAPSTMVSGSTEIKLSEFIDGSAAS